MKEKRVKYLVGFLIIIAALVYLFLTTFRSSLQYYVTVSELKGDYLGKTLKVAGRAYQIVRKEGTFPVTHEFVVREGGKEIFVTYSGLVPDTFREGADVVVTGTLGKDGSFRGDQILAKCASKYEAKLKE